MTNKTVSTEVILTSNFVRYNQLNQLIRFAFADSKATCINLYLDMYGVMKTLFSDSYRTDITDYTAVTTTILNMCGHYRYYFKGLGVHTKIYIIFSYNVPEFNRSLVPEYNKSFLMKTNNALIKEMVEKNCSLLDVLCPFLYDIFFLRTDYESTVLIDYLISIGDKNPNLIISKDIYPCQLTYSHADTAYIKPKKLNGEDLSVIIPPRDNLYFRDAFWDVYCSSRGQNVKLNKSSIQVHPMTFSLISALTRFPERDMKTITNLTEANRLIYSVIGKEAISLDAEFLKEVNTLRKNPLDLNLVSLRQKAIGVQYISEIYRDSIEAKTIKLDNFEDPASVQMICAEYFRDNPVDLTRL